MRISDEPLEQVALAIGRACYWWSSIEIELQALCANLARFVDHCFEREEVWDVVAVCLSHMDIRQRVAVAKAIAATSIDPDLYGTLAMVLNRIDNDLRVERNRYIHDQWMMLDESIVRRTHGAKVVRPQSRQLEVRLATDKIYGSPEEVDEFAERVANGLADIQRLNRDLNDLYDEIWPPEESDSLDRVR